MQIVKRYPGEDIPYDLVFEREINQCLNIIAVLYKQGDNDTITEVLKFSKEIQEGYNSISFPDNFTLRLLIPYATTKDIANTFLYADGYLIEETEGDSQNTYFIDDSGFEIKDTPTKLLLP